MDAEIDIEQLDEEIESPPNKHEEIHEELYPEPLWLKNAPVRLG